MRDEELVIKDHDKSKFVFTARIIQLYYDFTCIN